MSQASLFDDLPKVASVRRSDPRTAKAAAAHDPSGRDRQRHLILTHLVAHGPCTADELAPVIDRHRTIASTRLNVLGRAGLAEKCGTKKCADSYGRMRWVELWRATDAGRSSL